MTNWPVPSLLKKLRELEAEEHQLKGYVDQAQELWRVKAQQVQDVRSHLKALLNEAGVTTEHDDLATVTISRTPGRLVVEEPDLIPDTFFDLKPVRDDARIKQAIMAGQDVPGAKIVHSEAIRVKWKD